MKKKKDINKLVCDICGAAAAHEVKRTKVFGKGPQMIVIEDIPFISCDNCHQTYATAETMRALDEIRMNRERLTVPREIGWAKIA
jgi:YgiT-type zinc finger domain-containing protein